MLNRPVIYQNLNCLVPYVGIDLLHNFHYSFVWAISFFFVSNFYPIYKTFAIFSIDRI